MTKGTPFLTHMQKQCKALVYRMAKHWRLHVEDKGDMMMMHSTLGSGIVAPVMLTVDDGEAHVMQRIQQLGAAQ